METELRALEQVAHALATTGNVDRLLRQIVHRAAQLCNAPIALLTAVTPGKQELEIVAAHRPNQRLIGTHMRPADTVHGLVISSNHSLYSDSSTAAHPQRCLVPGTEGGGALLVVPMRRADGAFGTLALARHRLCRFTARDEALATVLADAASIAIQQAGLRRQLNDRLSSVSERRPRSSRRPSSVVRASESLGFLSDNRFLPFEKGGEERFANGGRSQLDGPNENCVGLSPRQREIVQLLMEGRTAKQIGSILSLSARTIEHHLERLKRRFKQPRLHSLVGHLAARRLAPR